MQEVIDFVQRAHRALLEGDTQPGRDNPQKINDATGLPESHQTFGDVGAPDSPNRCLRSSRERPLPPLPQPSEENINNRFQMPPPIIIPTPPDRPRSDSSSQSRRSRESRPSIVELSFIIPGRDGSDSGASISQRIQNAPLNWSPASDNPRIPDKITRGRGKRIPSSFTLRGEWCVGFASLLS